MHHEPVSSGAFAEALFVPDLPPPEGLTGRGQARLQRRFGVYRNNVTVTLVDALASIFPTVQNLVGADFFRAMARIYVAAHPPTSPVLLTYGEGFPSFLETFQPAADLPFLADVARVERLWLDSYHAADADPLVPATLGQIAAEELPVIRFRLHPATRIIRLKHAAGTICSRDRAGLPLKGVDPRQPEAVLITRPAFDVTLQTLPTGGATFFARLVEGHTLGDACLEAGEESADIPTLISLALTSGAFTAIDIVEESTSP